MGGKKSRRGGLKVIHNPMKNKRFKLHHYQTLINLDKKFIMFSVWSSPQMSHLGVSMNGQLNFAIGDKVVYPNHGVGVIEQISSRTIGPNVHKFYLLKIKASSLKVEVPFNNVSMVGLRAVVKNGEVAKIITFLVDGKCENHTDWKFRFKENSDKMRTGSLLEVAIVLKGLLLLAKDKPLSFREKKMLERARYLLVTELAMAKNVDEVEIEDMLNKALSKSKLKFPEVTADA